MVLRGIGCNLAEDQNILNQVTLPARTAEICTVKYFLCVIFFMITSLSLFSQEPLQRGFENILLGMTLTEVKAALKESGSFSYRGDPDVSMLRDPQTSLIEVDGGNFILRGAFQFHQDRLHTITLVLNPRLLDYFSFFTSFSKKYGNPKALDPSRAFWEDGKTRLVLEKTLTVKYLDMTTLETLAGQSLTQEAQGKLAREYFIDKF